MKLYSKDLDKQNFDRSKTDSSSSLSVGAPPESEIRIGNLPSLMTGFAEQVKFQMEEELAYPKKKVLIIAGPTAVGKSALAIEIAKKMQGEIVSADAIQVYRGMDIGTAKVTEQQRAMVQHHLIDNREIDEPYNVVDFCDEARACCKVIALKNRLPIVVGGSGFYLHSLIYGPPSSPPSIPEMRSRIEGELKEQGLDVLFEKLKELDPHYAATITKHDQQKIVRALEIIELSGKPVSMHSWKGRKRVQHFEFHCWFLYRPKAHLDEIINLRCDQMIKEGLVEEVRHLMENGLENNTSASQAIGYRQTIEYLKSAQTEKDWDQFLHELKKASRRYAKRQFTWFKKEPFFRWLDLDLHDPETVQEMIIRDISNIS